LRILHVASHFGVYRGGAVQLCRLASTQKRLGHDVYVIYNLYRKQADTIQKRDYNSWNRLKEAGIHAEPMSYQNIRGILHLRKIIKTESFDIVHAHRDQALEISWLALWKIKRPCLIAQRGTVSRPPIFPLIAFRSHRTPAVVAVSRAVKAVLVDCGLDAQKVNVIYGSVDLEEFTPKLKAIALRKQLGIPPDSTIIGSLSAFRKAKGFDYLMPALAKIMRKYKNVHSVFLGFRVPQKILPLAEELGIIDRCHFVGHQTNVAEWLSIMDFTVIAAIGGEGLSGVLRESLAMEIPAISTDHAGNNEIIIDKHTGLLVPQKDIDALAAAMDWALVNPASMKEMARQGRSWVESNCSTKVQAE